MSKKELDKIVGAAYEDLNAEDMQQSQGAGDVNAEVVSNCLTITPSVVVTNPPILSVSIGRL